MEQRISIERMEQAVNIFGSFDENIRLLEKEFNVTVTNRDGELRISGEAEDVMHAAKAVQAMLTLSSRGEALGEQNVRYIIDMVRTGKEEHEFYKGRFSSLFYQLNVKIICFCR